MASSFASSQAFPRKPLPRRFCNLDRVLHALEARDLDGIVATLPNNVFYLSGFNGIAHKSDEPRVCAVILSRHAPGHPVMVVADYYLATFLTQETSIEDIRPFRAVMMPLDLPVQKTDIERFIPRLGKNVIIVGGIGDLRDRWASLYSYASSMRNSRPRTYAARWRVSSVTLGCLGQVGEPRAHMSSPLQMLLDALDAKPLGDDPHEKLPRPSRLHAETVTGP